MIGTVGPTNEVQPRSGSFLALLGGAEYATKWIAQSINLPAGHAHTLDFYYQIRSDTAFSCDISNFPGDAYVYINQTVVFQRKLCQDYDTAEWTYVSIDLSAYDGQTVVIKFYSEASDILLSSLYLDDISILIGP